MEGVQMTKKKKAAGGKTANTEVAFVIKNLDASPEQREHFGRVLDRLKPQFVAEIGAGVGSQIEVTVCNRFKPPKPPKK